MKKLSIIFMIFTSMMIITGCEDLVIDPTDNVTDNITDNNTTDNNTDSNTDNNTENGTDNNTDNNTDNESKPEIPDGDIIPAFPLNPAQPRPIKDLFMGDFGSNQNVMYFALHITGKSTKSKFLQVPSGNLGQGDGIGYARDLKIIYNGYDGSPTTSFPFSAKYKELGLSDVYSEEYGFTEKTGNNLDMRFYLGYPTFYVPLNSRVIKFTSFSIVDLTKPIWGGFADMVFVRCGLSGGVEHFQFPLPIDEYNSAIHKNIAKFTIEFNDNLCDQNGYTVTFDGFVKK